MKMYLISDNVDTYTGMRLAGVDGVSSMSVKNSAKRLRMCSPIKRSASFSSQRNSAGSFRISSIPFVWNESSRSW